MVTLVVGFAAVVGWGDHGRRERTSAPAVCQACGVDGSLTLPWIAQMQTAPRWQARDNAARYLRRFPWREHPEVVLALCDTLLNDPKDDVREEAAESLREMAPCVPAAHEALQIAARRDPEDDVREEAREALSKLRRHRCLGACVACAPAPAPGFGPGETIVINPDPIPPAWVPLLVPEGAPAVSELTPIAPPSGPGAVPTNPGTVTEDPLPPALPDFGPRLRRIPN